MLKLDYFKFLIIKCDFVKKFRDIHSISQLIKFI